MGEGRRRNRPYRLSRIRSSLTCEARDAAGGSTVIVLIGDTVVEFVVVF
jgi:hypothetical protein